MEAFMPLRGNQMEYYPELEDYTPDSSTLIALMTTKVTPGTIADAIEKMIVSGKYQGYAMCVVLEKNSPDTLDGRLVHLAAANFIRKYLEIKYPRAKRNLTLDRILTIEFPQDAWLYRRPSGVTFNEPRKNILEAPFECRIACSNWYWALIRDLRALHAYQS